MNSEEQINQIEMAIKARVFLESMLHFGITQNNDVAAEQRQCLSWLINLVEKVSNE